MKFLLIYFSVILFAFGGGDPYGPTQPNLGPSLKIIKRADAITFTLNVTSEIVDPKLHLASSSEFRKSIVESFNSSKKYRIKFDPIFFTTEGRSGFISRAFSLKATQTLTPSDNDLFLIVKEFQDFLGSLKKVEKINIQMMSAVVGFENIETNRFEMLKKIGDDVAIVLQSCGQNGKISLTGVNNPLNSRQIDDFNFEVWLDYVISYEITKTTK